MIQISSWLHSTFTELSNGYSHAQIRVKTKKLWPRQVVEEKQVVVQKLSRPSKLSRSGNSVATKKTVSRPKTLEKTKKRPKIDILAYFQAHFTLGPYIYSFFLGKEGSRNIGEPLS